MKVTKKLVAAVVCFLCSIAFCVIACYAWFASNEDVHGNNLTTEVNGPRADVSVKAYFLSESRSLDGSITYTVTTRHVSDTKISNGQGDGELNGEETMLRYNTDPLSSTALLLEIDCFSADVGEYYISVGTKTTDFTATKASSSSSTSQYNGNLSNVVHFNSVEASGNPLACTLGLGTAQYSLVKGTQVINDNPVATLTFTESDEMVDGFYKQTHYLIMDYDDGHMSDLYQALSADESLKEIIFASDVIIRLTVGEAELQPDPDNTVQKVIDLIGAIGTVNKNSGTKIASARAAYDRLSAAQKALVTNYAVLTTAESAFSQFAVDDFNAKFDELDALTVSTSNEYKTKLEAAEAAYGLLNDTQKAQVSANYASLVSKREAYENLVQQAKDQTAADAVIARIDAIGTVTLSSGSAIDGARAAYENLTAAQKALVPTAKLNTLTAAEEEYARLQSLVAVTGVSLDKTTASLKVGDTVTLTATIAPANATNIAVTWSSNKTSVATVEDGVVTAVGAGEATITVTTEDGGFTATCTVTVNSSSVTYSVIEDFRDAKDLKTYEVSLSADAQKYLTSVTVAHTSKIATKNNINLKLQSATTITIVAKANCKVKIAIDVDVKLTVGETTTSGTVTGGYVEVSLNAGETLVVGRGGSEGTITGIFVE